MKRLHFAFPLVFAAIFAVPAPASDARLENRVRLLEQSVRALTLGAPPAAVRDDTATRRRLDHLALEVDRLKAEVRLLRERLDALSG
jgi:hypothetical protein